MIQLKKCVVIWSSTNSGDGANLLPEFVLYWKEAGLHADIVIFHPQARGHTLSVCQPFEDRALEVNLRSRTHPRPGQKITMRDPFLTLILSSCLLLPASSLFLAHSHCYNIHGKSLVSMGFTNANEQAAPRKTTNPLYDIISMKCAS